MGSKAPTTTSTSTVPPQVLAQYQQVVDRANNVANTPYQAYTGQLTAGLNPLQNQAYYGLGTTQSISEPYATQGLDQATQGFNTTSSAQPMFAQGAQGLGAASPYYQQGANTINGAQGYYGQAANYAKQSAGPLNLSQYLSPYTQNVIDSTMANINKNNSIQQQGVISGGIQAGNAFGGDRMGVAQAELARNQDLASNQTIAGLENQNYSQALSAAQADASRQAQTSSLLGGLGNSQIQAGLGYGQIGSGLTSNALGYGQLGQGVGNLGGTMSGQGVATAGLGTQAQNNAIGAYQAQMGAGTQAQQTSQADLNAQYQQWANQIAFPYQQTGWLSNISTGIGSGSGGTTTSTGSAPSALSQITGGAMAIGALAALKRGGVVPYRAAGGPVVQSMFPPAGHMIDFSGVPGGSAGGLIPTIQINQAHSGAPAAVDPNKGQTDTAKQGQQAATAIGGLSGLFNSPTGFGASSAMGDATGLGGLYARGGLVPGYADGGVPDFSDRWAPVDDAESDLTFQPGQMVSPGLVPTAPVAPDQPAVDTKGPTDPVAEPFRLDGSYRDNPDNTVPMTPAVAAANYRGDDVAPAGLGAVAAIDKAAGIAPQPSSALAYDTPAPGLGAASAPPMNLVPPGLAPASTLPVAHNDGTQPAGGLLGRMGVTEDGRQAMLRLGLGLLASRSPNFGTALGEAGLGAVSSLGDLQKQRIAQTEKDRDYQLQVQRLSQAAEAAKVSALNQPIIIGADGKPTVNPDYIAARTALELPAGFRKNASGGIEPIPGGPADPAYLKTKSDATDKGKPVPVGRDRYGNVQYGVLHDDGKYYSAVTGKPLGETAQAQAQTDANIDNLHGEERAKAEGWTRQQIAEARALSTYQKNPQSISSRNGMRSEAIDRAIAFDPNYRDAEYPTAVASLKAFATGKQGDIMRSMDVGLSHLDVLENLAGALDNGNTQKINAAKNYFKEQFGYDAPTNFDAVKSLVGAEVAKAIVGGQNALTDREDLRDQLVNAKSPTQIKGVVDSWKALMAGQLYGLKPQFEINTKMHNFEEHLSEPTRKFLKSHPMGTGTVGGTPNGKPGEVAPSAKPAMVRQNGHVYKLSADGNTYEAVQ